MQQQQRPDDARCVSMLMPPPQPPPHLFAHRRRRRLVVVVVDWCRHFMLARQRNKNRSILLLLLLPVLLTAVSTAVFFFNISSSSCIFSSSLFSPKNLQTVPKIVHFYFEKSPNSTKSLQFHHYLAIKAAAVNIKPEKLFLHFLRKEDEPQKGTWLERSSKYISHLNCLSCSSLKDNNGNNFLNTIDVGDNSTDEARQQILIRLGILKVFGGIYLDLDVVVLKNFDQLFTGQDKKDFYLAKEGPGNYYTLPSVFIVASKSSSFLARWFDWYFNLGNPISDGKIFTNNVQGAEKVSRALSNQFPTELGLLHHRAVFWPLDTQNGISEMYLTKEIDFLREPHCIAVHLKQKRANVFLEKLEPQQLSRVGNSLFCALRSILYADDGFGSDIDLDHLKQGCDHLGPRDFAQKDEDVEQAAIVSSWKFLRDNSTLPIVSDLTMKNGMEAVLSPLNSYAPFNQSAIYHDSRRFLTLQGDHVYLPIAPFRVLAGNFSLTAAVNLVARRNTEDRGATLISAEFRDCNEVSEDDLHCSWLFLNVERPFDGSIKLVVYSDDMSFSSVLLTSVFADEWHNVTLSVTTNWAVLYVDGVKQYPFLYLRNAIQRPLSHSDITLKGIWLGTRATREFDRPLDHSGDGHLRIKRANLVNRALHNEDSLEFTLAQPSFPF